MTLPNRPMSMGGFRPAGTRPFVLEPHEEEEEEKLNLDPSEEEDRSLQDMDDQE